MRAGCSSCGASRESFKTGGATAEAVVFCERCGSPNWFSEKLDYDPFRASRHWRVGRVDRRAKMVVRAGCLLVGAIVLLSGMVLFYGAWLNMGGSAEGGGHDISRLWVSRLLAPGLLVVGIIFVLSAFRAPPAAPVIQLETERALRRGRSHG
ncbi:MAG TPA: hypothetical protein PLH57_08525 [Oligoflexia bacterium]|nr:hypothetical protein [Oligoflexia bacterium]